MLFILFYNIFLGIYFLLTLPIYLLNLKKYRSTILERLFFSDKDIHVNKDKDLIWIHAVSLGEMKVAALLANQIKKNKDNISLVISSTTKTGYSEGKKSIAFADFHLFLPLDFSWTMKKIMKTFSPKHVILIETDFWYNFLNQAKKNKATISLINGKISDRSYKRYKLFKYFTGKLFSFFDVITVQDETYKSKLLNLNIDKRKVHVVGNLKCELTPTVYSSEELSEWRSKFKISEADKVITIASTHDPEEKLLLSNIPKGYKCFIAPRHPERFAAVKALLIKSNISFGYYSNIEAITGDEQIILIDTMGKLNLCYQLSDLAIVGGSFTEKLGGHNILEPILLNTPVFFGPSMYSQEELQNIALKAGCGKETTLETLQMDILNYFESEVEVMESNCHKFNKSQLGLTEKTCQILGKYL